MRRNKDIPSPREGDGTPAHLRGVAARSISGVSKEIEPAGFIRSAWFEMLSNHCFAEQIVVMARAQIDNASATLPLVDEDTQLAALANYYSFEYGALFEGADDPAIRFALLKQIAANVRRTHHRVCLYPLIDDNGTAEALRRAFAAAGWIALLTDQNSNYVLDIGKRDFSAYWAKRPGALRSAVKRKSRLGLYEFDMHDCVTDALWQDYTNVYAESWKNAEPWPAMIRSIAQEAANRGVLRLGFAHKAGKAVAVQLWTIEGKTACIHKLAHDSAEDKGSPGTLLSHYMFRHMIDVEKVEHIDYGTGANAYKRDWMERERPMLRLDCFDPRKAAMWLPALKTCISQLVGRST